MLIISALVTYTPEMILFNGTFNYISMISFKIYIYLFTNTNVFIFFNFYFFINMLLKYEFIYKFGKALN